MKKKLIIIFFTSFLLLFISIGVQGVSISQKPININSDIEKEPSVTINEDEISGEPINPHPSIHANAGGPYSGTINVPIKFSCIRSNIPDAITYQWDFDDKIDDSPGFGKTPIHSYSEPGIYYVTLTITDNKNNQYKDIAPVYIDCIGDHLIPYGGCFYYAEVDETIKFDASNSISNGADIIEYFWDFGDGTTGVGEYVIHKYKKERVYMVTLDITDKNGITRHDVLHADIGMTYSDEEDFFHNLPDALQEVLDFLLNRNDLQANIFNNILDTKIYTNFNGIEKWTELKGISPLPVEIDVNGNGVNDVKVDKLKYFNPVKGPSLFDRNSRIWYQFETTLSEVKKISSDITSEDDFTVCLQMDFGFIADKLELDDTIIRMGYNSPSGEGMPDSISLTHILRPYLLFRMLGWDNSHAKGVNSGLVVNQPHIDSSGISIDNIAQPLNLESYKSKFFTNSKIENVFNSIQDIKSKSVDLKEKSEPKGFPGGYWPEYGLRISSSGGGDFSLFGMILNGAGSSKTTVKISYGSSTSSLVYKRAKTGGILNHGAVFEIPGKDAKLSILREKNNDVTEISTGFSFSSKLLRGIGWSDKEFWFTIDGESSVDIFDFNFNNPNFNLSFNQIALSAAGYIDFQLIDGVKLELDGNTGFILSDLKFDGKTSGLKLEINGTFSMDVDGFVHLAIASGLLEIGFNGDLYLSSNCKFIANGESVTTGGDFYLGSDGIISFSWESDSFTIDLDSGFLLRIENLNFEVGDLIANASKIEIGASGKFDISWDTGNSEVTISGGPDVSLGLEDVEIIYGTSLNVKVIGAFSVAADGYITFGPNIFKAGFSGTLDLGSSCEFEINGEGLIVGGIFELIGGEGEISFSWDEDEFSLDVSGGPELSVSDLYFQIGNLTIAADNIGIGASGQFNIIWDTSNNEVTINGGSGASLSVTNVDINYEGALYVRIIGSLDIQADGYIVFGPDVFKAGFSGSLNLGSQCEFEINGERLKIGGLFTLSSGNGEIGFNWTEDEFTLYVSGSPELTVSNLFFEVGDLTINSKYVGIEASGEFNVEWDVESSEITINSNIYSGLEIEDLDINYNTILSVQIIGSFDIQADGYITFAPGVFKAGFSGTLDFGTSCQFVINSEVMSVGGTYVLSGGSGEIEFNWAEDEFSLFVSGSPSLGVTDLFFEAGDLSVGSGYVGIGVSGEFNIDLDIPDNEITISSGGGVSLQITDLEITYGTTLDVSITGSLEIQADGYVIFAPGVFTANFEGTLDLGTGGSYCEFEINGQSIKIGGEFSLSTGSGEISFEWSSDSVTLMVQGGPKLYVADLYFEAGDLKVQSEYVEIGINGEFNVDLNTGAQEVTISGTSGVSLSIENVNISYGTTLSVKIIGAFEIQAGGYITFGPGVFKAGFDGTLDLGTQTEFEINGNSITVGGFFTLIGQDGEIIFSWAAGDFSLEVSGGPSLKVDDFYFAAEISNNDFVLSVEILQIGINGDFNLEWFSGESKIKLSTDVGSYLQVENVEVLYGTTIDIRIIGYLEILADGFVSVAPGLFEASFAGQIILSPGFRFEIDGDSIYISGEFLIPQGLGNVEVSWDDGELSFDLSGGVALVVDSFYFESDNIKADASGFTIGVNGLLILIYDDGIDKIEIDSDVAFKIENLLFDVYINNQWETIISFQNFEIGGAGNLLIESGTDSKIQAGFNVNFKIQNLQLTPPVSWNCGLSIGYAELTGSAQINIMESTSGDVIFDLSSGSASGNIASFNAYLQIGGNELEITFSGLELSGNFNLDIDSFLQVSGGGTLKFNEFYASFGSTIIEAEINLIGNGNFDCLWANIQFDLDFDADFNWNIFVDFTNIGSWDLHGSLEGDVEISAELTDTTGGIEINVNDPGVLHSFSVEHDNLNFTLGEFQLSPGLIIISWYRDDSIHQGNFYINSGISVTIDLAKITWSTKTVEFSILNVKPGEFKFTWDEPSKKLTINNGMQSFGPYLTFIDTSQNLEITGSLFGLQSDYSKTITLQWYEDNGQIVGIYIDTANTHLAQYLQISYKKDNTGKRITVYGLQCDAFYIVKDGGQFKWGGKIYVANRVTFSKLISNQWRDLDVRWNLQSQEKWIRFERDSEFELVLQLFQTEILGFTISSTLNLMDGEYFEIRWDIGVTGSVYIDTNWEYLASINLLIGPDYGIGVDLTVSAIRAEDWSVEWTAWPPAEWNVQTQGNLQVVGIDIEVYYDGEWHHLWPW
jgi:PKD repeat protein